MSLIRKTIGQCLSEAAIAFRDRPALISGEAVLDFGQMEEESDKIACALLRLGVQKGSHIGIWMADSPELALCFYAVVKLGAVVVPLNVNYMTEEITYALKYTDVEYLLIDSGREEGALGLASEELPALRGIISASDAPGNIMSLPALTERPQSGDSEKLDEAGSAVLPEDVAAILFTSGTTSKPKGAVLTHYGMVNNSLAMIESLRMTHDDRLCLTIPLFHCFSISANLLSCLHCGAALVFPQSRHSQDILAAVSERRCTILNAVPTLLLTMIRRPDFEQYDISSLRAGILGGTYTPPEQYLMMRDRLCMTLLSSLGQTEATAGVTMLDYDAPLETGSATVGRLLPHIEGKIISLADGEALPCGESGEICIRGYGVMKGYYRPDVDGSAVDTAGWLHTGDLGYMDRDGNLHLTGRRKEIIIRGGENISPSELEECLISDSRIEAVKCVGVEDSHFGEEVCACVKLKAGESMSDDEVRGILRGRLAYYKVPRYVLFVDGFDTTASGKIRTSALKEYVLRTLFD